MSTFMALAAKFQGLAGEMAAIGVTNVAAAAALVEASVAFTAGRYRGSRMMRTKTTVIPGSTPRALVRMPSRLAHLLDQDTRAHPILPVTSTFLAITATSFAASVHHPGTKGQHMWEEGVALALPKISKMAQTSLTGAVARAFA